MVQRTFIEILEDFQLVCEDRAFDVAVQLSFCESAFDNFLVETQVLPVEYKEEEQDWNEDPNQKLEIVIPYVVDIRCNSFP